MQKEQELRERQKRKAEEEKLKAKKRAQEKEALRLKKIAEQKEKERLAAQKRLAAEEKRLQKEQAFREQQKLKAQKEKDKLLEKRKIVEEKKRLEGIEKEQNENIKDQKLAEFKVINKNEFYDDFEKKKQKIVVQKLNEKVLLDELVREREEEIRKRKYSNYNAINNVEKSDDNTKYFFDETVAQKFSSKNSIDTEVSKFTVNRKALVKKNVNAIEPKKKEKIVTAFNAKKPIIKLKDKKFVEKTETFFYENDDVELDINQKMKISDYVNQIIDKPIKIEIKPNFVLEDNNKNVKVKHLAKSRSLLIRAYLLKLGISHNRIKILMEESLGENTLNKVVINFIEL